MLASAAVLVLPVQTLVQNLLHVNLSLLSCSGESGWPGAFGEQANLSVPQTGAQPQLTKQPPQGWAHHPQALTQHPQGPIMSHYQQPGMSPLLHPIRSSHLVQHHSAQLQNPPQAVAQQQQQQQQDTQEVSGAVTQHPGIVSVDPNIPNFFQPHLGLPGNEGHSCAGYATVPVTYSVAACTATTSTMPATSLPLLLPIASVSQASIAVGANASDAAPAAALQGSVSQVQAEVHGGGQLKCAYGVYPQYGAPLQHHPSLMPDAQMGFGYLLTAPQLPPGVMYQQVHDPWVHLLAGCAAWLD